MLRTLVRLLGWIRPHGRLATAAFGCTLLSNLFSLVIPKLLGQAIDNGLAQGSMLVVLGLALGILAASLLRGLTSYGNSYYGEALSQGVAFDLRNALLDKAQHLSFGYYSKMPTGQLMSRATEDVEQVRWWVTYGLIRLGQLLVLLVGTSVLLLLINWELALAGMAIFPFLLYRSVTVSPRLRARWNLVQDKLGEQSEVIQESITGVRVVKSFNRETYEAEKFGAKAREVYRAEIDAARLYNFHVPFMSMMVVVATGLVLWYGGHQVLAGALTAGELTEFILYLAMLAQPVRMTGWALNLFTRAASAGGRIFEVLDAESPVKEKPDAVDLPRARGEVVFDHVSFAYENTQVLKDVSFRAAQGGKVALVGTTGSGKSSIAHLLPRFYDVTGGRITIDGVDVRDATLASLRRNVGIVLQDVFLFSGTIRDNIAYGKVDASQEDVERVARLAQLHDFIASLPQRYDTWVGERGITLSGGQKQRVAIARTLLMDPPVLILDDSTSSLDTETEHALLQATRDVVRRRTTIMITQRLDSARDADLIIFLDNGHVVERGVHAELMAARGHYHQVYELQRATRGKSILTIEEAFVQDISATNGTAPQNTADGAPERPGAHG